MRVALTWLGVSTFQLDVGETTIFLDTFVDRLPTAPPVGLLSKDVEKADVILVGHSHLDHLLGAETIAPNTGAKVIASFESVRMLAGEGVAENQLVAVSGGERVAVGDDIRIRVFPGLHSCIWATQPAGVAECLSGEDGLSLQEQRAKIDARWADKPFPPYHGRGEIAQARGDGGALAFLIETPEGSIWWNDTSGYWSGVARSIRPDVAILAAVGRGNLDGEPVQGSLAEFVAAQAELLRPERVILCHHDDWNPGVTHAFDMTPLHTEVRARAGSAVDIPELSYSDPVAIFAGR